MHCTDGGGGDVQYYLPAHGGSPKFTFEGGSWVLLNKVIGVPPPPGCNRRDCYFSQTEARDMHCTPIATVSGRRSTPSTGGTESTIQAVQHGTLTGARPLTPTQEQRLIETVTTLGARAAPAVLLSVIAICRQYLTEPQQQTVRAHEN
jgi:hypothetical protein